MSGLQLTWMRRGERVPGARPVLAVEGLVVRVGARRVLDGVSLEVFAGDHVRVTGPNGCGKSTLLNAIAGTAPAKVEQGNIRFQGEDITALPTHERAGRGLAYMRQTDSVFPSLTVGENLVLALGRDGYTRFAEAFPDWAADLPADKRAGKLSGGQRKKLAWGMTVLRKGIGFVLLDEPRAGLDAGQRAVLKPPVKLATLVVEHYTESESGP